MFDTRDLRAAALSFGIVGLIGAFPLADGDLAIEDAAHTLAAYRYDLNPLVIIRDIDIVDEAITGPTLTADAVVGPTITGETLR